MLPTYDRFSANNLCAAVTFIFDCPARYVVSCFVVTFTWSTPSPTLNDWQLFILTLGGSQYFANTKCCCDPMKTNFSSPSSVYSLFNFNEILIITWLLYLSQVPQKWISGHCWSSFLSVGRTTNSLKVIKTATVASALIMFRTGPWWILSYSVQVSQFYV